VPLELARDIAVAGTDEVQDFNDWPVCSHRAAGREGDGQDRGRDHQGKHGNSDGDRGARHGPHALDPGAMIVKRRSYDLLREGGA
jgi:hypothetical protein